VNREIAQEWLRSAEANLRTIGRILDDEALTHVVALFAQQCVEKCLRALLKFGNRPVSKDHSERCSALFRDP
jgi:HEPN domain-containing protein